jgi:hypothetical protein
VYKSLYFSGNGGDVRGTGADEDSSTHGQGQSENKFQETVFPFSHILSLVFFKLQEWNLQTRL